jgi:hypothetical protein
MNPLTGWRERIQDRFQQRPDRFIEWLCQQAFITVHGTRALVDYMKQPGKKHAARVRTLEVKADDMRRVLVEEINRSFVTPIDREDLFALSRAIDDVLDYAYSTTNEMDILQVVPNAYLLSMAELLNNGAEEMHHAIERLERDPQIASNHAIRIKALGNKMESLYAEALAHLFDAPQGLADVIMIFKMREVYRHMFHAVGSAEQAANVISDIVIKSY